MVRLTVYHRGYVLILRVTTKTASKTISRLFRLFPKGGSTDFVATRMLEVLFQLSDIVLLRHF